MKLNKPVVILDIETTGLSISKDRIVKIDLKKMIDLDGTAEIKTYLLNPNKEISQGAFEVHGISNKDVVNEPYFSDICEELCDFIDGCVLVGYNIKGFDFPLLYEEFNRTDVILDINSYDIVDLKQIFYSKEPRTLQGAHRQYTYNTK